MMCLNCGNKIEDSIYNNKLCNDCNKLFDEQKKNPNSHPVNNNVFKKLEKFHYTIGVISGILVGINYIITAKEFNFFVFTITIFISIIIGIVIGSFFKGLGEILNILKEIRDILYNKKDK
jgi:hypothetical protein